MNREYKYQKDTLTIANGTTAGQQAELLTKLDTDFSRCTGVMFVLRTAGGLDRSTSTKYMELGIKNAGTQVLDNMHFDALLANPGATPLFRTGVKFDDCFIPVNIDIKGQNVSITNEIFATLGSELNIDVFYRLEKC